MTRSPSTTAASKGSTLSLLDLPPEVVHGICIEADPADLAAVSGTCRALRQFVASDRVLFRDVYRRHWDDPVPARDGESRRWEKALADMVKLGRILESSDVEVKKASLGFVVAAVTDSLGAVPPGPAPSLNLAFLTEHFRSPANIDGLLCGSALFDRCRGAPPGRAGTDGQLSAKLHCLYGVPIDGPRGGAAHRRATYPYACSKVYDLRNYTDANLWGPFADDGSQRTDWEKVEAVMIVLGHDMHRLSRRTNVVFEPVWTRPFAGATPGSYVPSNESLLLGAQPRSTLEMQDPYNVTGTWMQLVCYLNYTELYAYNFTSCQPPPDRPRGPLDTDGIIRLILMKLRVTGIEPAGEGDGRALPVVYFKGTSRSPQASWDINANAKVRGSVRLTPEGEVRWTTLSIYQGQERWRSEGIQVGGVQSARGVLGTWFYQDYGAPSLVGPTAFWKTSDEGAEKERARPVSH